MTRLRELPDFRTAIGQSLFNCCNEVEQESGQMIVCLVQAQPHACRRLSSAPDARPAMCSIQLLTSVLLPYPAGALTRVTVLGGRHRVAPANEGATGLCRQAKQVGILFAAVEDSCMGPV